MCVCCVVLFLRQGQDGTLHGCSRSDMVFSSGALTLHGAAAAVAAG
jgi:hypothetical protein